jgi:NADH dehydrogenase [ubiquinone] 1 alpha subcomplex assembly factor 7
VIANEFFDALPVHQAVMTPDGWHERMVGLDGKLVFALHPMPLPEDFDHTHLVPADPPVGSIYEWRSETLVRELAGRIARQGGAALIIDYGHIRSGVGETLQAVKDNRYADPLAAPGETDLTAHVDFAALAEIALREGAHVDGPLPQWVFLQRLGIVARARSLKERASPEQAAAIDGALARLAGNGREQMGELFQAFVIVDPKLPTLPGFEDAGEQR